MKWGNLVDVDDVTGGLVAVEDTSTRRQLGELEEAIGKVPLEQRQVILLVGLEGMSYEEVATILGVPVGTVRSRLSRGRTALRRLMGMEEEHSSISIAASFARSSCCFSKIAAPALIELLMVCIDLRARYGDLRPGADWISAVSWLSGGAEALKIRGFLRDVSAWSVSGQP